MIVNVPIVVICKDSESVIPFLDSLCKEKFSKHRLTTHGDFKIEQGQFDLDDLNDTFAFVESNTISFKCRYQERVSDVLNKIKEHALMHHKICFISQ